MKFRLYNNDQVQNLQNILDALMHFRLYDHNKCSDVYNNSDEVQTFKIATKFRLYNNLDRSSDFTIS